MEDCYEIKELVIDAMVRHIYGFDDEIMKKEDCRRTKLNPDQRRKLIYTPSIEASEN